MPSTQLEDHLLSTVRDCLFNIFAVTLHTGGRSSIPNLRIRHPVVTGTDLSRVRAASLNIIQVNLRGCYKWTVSPDRQPVACTQFHLPGYVITWRIATNSSVRDLIKCHHLYFFVFSFFFRFVFNFECSLSLSLCLFFGGGESGVSVLWEHVLLASRALQA